MLRTDPYLGRRDTETPDRLFRTHELDLRLLDEEARTVPAVLSTSGKVSRFFGWEKLEHSKKAVDLGRAARGGLPLLFVHDQRDPIGRVLDVKLEGARLVGTLRFGTHARAEEVFQMVRAGDLTDVSIGYRVTKWQDEEGGRLAVRWEVLEASVVAVGADPNAGMRRDDDPDPAPAPSSREGGERRVLGIAEAFRAFPGHQALMHECLADTGCTVATARQRLLEAIAEGTEEIQGSRAATAAGEDDADKISTAIREALILRHELRPEGAYDKRGEPIPRSRWQQAVVTEAETAWKGATEGQAMNPAAGMRLVDLARLSLVRIHNVSEAARWSNDRVVSESLKRAAIIGHGPDDFTNLLANNTNKMLALSYMEAPETWQQWCRVGSLPDFKAGTRPNMSTFGDLDNITGDQEYKYKTFSDRAEPIQLQTYGALFSISRTAIINDDQSAFSEIPRHMGRAAARMVGDRAYLRLTANAALTEDSTALFHANHSNLVASGTAPTVAALNTMLTNMATQTDPAGNTLNLRPAYILVPWALWGTTRTLLVSAVTPGATVANEANIWQAQLEQVTEARLDAASAVQWYIAASQMSVGTVEVAFLDGNQTPFLDQETGFTRDGVAYKVRLDFEAAPLDYRGLARNNGE